MLRTQKPRSNGLHRINLGKGLFFCGLWAISERAGRIFFQFAHALARTQMAESGLAGKFWFRALVSAKTLGMLPTMLASRRLRISLCSENQRTWLNLGRSGVGHTRISTIPAVRQVNIYHGRPRGYIWVLQRIAIPADMWFTCLQQERHTRQTRLGLTSAPILIESKKSSISTSGASSRIFWKWTRQSHGNFGTIWSVTP